MDSGMTRGLQDERTPAVVVAASGAALAVVEEPTAPVRLTDVQRRAVLAAATGPEPAGQAPDLIEKLRVNAARRPRHIAVNGPDGTLTYAELDRLTDGLAVRLRALGVRRDSRVGVAVPRGARELASLLATLKAGGCYVPVDANHPPDRVKVILEDAAPEVLVAAADSPLVAMLPSGTTLLPLEQIWGPWEGSLAAEPAAPDQLAYILFTSGSTGRPKGVEIPRAALANFLRSMEREPGLSEADRLLAITTTTFDIAGLELFLPLWVGGTVIIADRETATDPRKLRALIEREPPTVLQATPATWRLLLEAGWRGDGRLRMLCGGEAMSPELAAKLLAAGGELWNVYGPTETTVWSTLDRVQPGSARISIGRPIDHTTVYILDPERQLVPPGEVGEIYIGGRGLARGYRNRPDLTSDRFVCDPYGLPGARMYRTGDLGRLLEDGRFECLGRIDHQVKVRGFRVELGEIEAALRGAPGVDEVVALADPRSDGDPVLCAYWVGAATREQLYERARAKLPAYMVPGVYLPVASFPLTPNGKIDRKALARPDASAAAPRVATGIPPRTPTEVRIAAIWSEVLGLSAIGVDQDFFSIGGTSIKVIEARTKIEEAFAVTLPLSAFFESPTTVETLITRMGRPTTAQSSLVLLFKGGDESPLFLVHDADGATLPYLNLARRLGGRRSVYGVQPLADGEVPIVHTRLVDMAAHYVAEIRKLQPRGPYLLGGLCAGGILAFEMAGQLEAAGEQARLVAVIDAADVEAAKKPYLQARRRMERLGDALREGGRIGAPLVMLSKLRGYLTYEVKRQLRQRTEKLGVATLRVCLDRGLPLPRWARAVPVRAVCDAAEAEYRPTHVVRDEIVLFRATGGAGADEAYKDIYEDPMLGWHKRTRGGVRVIDVPGGHGSMLEEPNVVGVAEPLAAYLATPRPVKNGEGAALTPGLKAV
jgi:amino acid adenylation domain-containing protein